MAFGGACGLHTLLRWTVDRHGGLEHGAEGFGPSWLARHGQRQGRCHFGCYLCRGSRSGPRLLRALRGDGTPGATGQSGRQLTHNSTFASQSHSHGHVLGSQGTGSQTAKAVPHAGASGTATPGRAIRMDLGLQRSFLPIWSWLGWSGCAQQKLLGAGSTISAGPNAGLFWGGAKDWSSSTFPSARQRAQRHEETLQQKGRSLACLSPLGGAGGWQHGRLEEGASFAGYVATVSQLARFHLATRSWPLGPRLGFSFTRSRGTLFAQSCNLWGVGRPRSQGLWFSSSFTHSKQSTLRQWIRHVVGGNGRRKLARDLREQRMASPRLASTSAMAMGWLGRQLLVNQMGTWLPLWLDPRRANAKQLADQEDMGEPLPRPSLEEVDNVCKTYKHTAGLGHDCINPKAILQLPVELRVRFIDLLMAFEAQLVKPLSWSHMMVLRPKPSGGHTIGLTAAPLRLLSRLRRPLAQKWENEHDAPVLLGLSRQSVRPCRLGTLHHGGGSKGAAAVGGFLVTRSGKVLTSTSGTTTSGKKAGQPVFPRDFWLVGALHDEGWRFLEADKCATFPFWAFGTILPGCSGATTAAKLMLATLLETVATRLPTYRLWNVVDDISGHVAGYSQDGASPHCRSGQASGGRPPGTRSAALQGQIQSPHRWPGQAQACPSCSSWRCSGSTSAIRHATWEPICSWAGGGGRSSSRGGWRGLQRERSASGSCARQGHTLASSPSLALMQGCFGVPRFWASLRHSSNQSESTRPKPHTGSAEGKTQPQRCWPTPRQRGQKHRSGLSTSSTSHLGLGDGSLGRHSRPRHHAGCTARLPGQAQSSQAAVVRRNGRSGHLSCSRSCGCAGARSPRDTSLTHDGTKIDLLAVAPKTVGYWVDQASLLWSDSSARWNQSKGPLFWEATRPLLVSGKMEGWSLWHQNVLVKLVSRGIWTQERLARLRGEEDGSCQLCNDGPGTMFHRCYECPALQAQKETCTSHRRCAWLHALWVRITGSSLHMAFFLTLARHSSNRFS